MSLSFSNAQVSLTFSTGLGVYAKDLLFGLVNGEADL
jgi:hypothetical protein